MKQNEYIGDGVYASHDGWQIWLGLDPQHHGNRIIALEPAVFKSLLEYASQDPAYAEVIRTHKPRKEASV
jgi:hypothetical protein